jgi:glutathione S-transferase
MDIYLHHYPASPFSEKVRLLLGRLDLAWQSVEIPTIMPRPLLMPLSGGYRRTPCLQIGANVYCDSAVIARGLVRHAGDATLFAPGFVAHRVAEWADSQLFRLIVALNFAPEAIGSIMSQLPPDQIQAFAADRAKLTEGASLTALSPAAARAHLVQVLRELDGSLGADFLFGADPSIADLSLFHCLWFLQNSPHNAPLLAPYKAVGGWMERIAGLGHGRSQEASPEAALAHARESEPVLPSFESALPDGLSLGAAVTVTPVDYGKIPVAGRLVACAVDEVVLERETPEAGRVFTHFPMAGFEVARAD